MDNRHTNSIQQSGRVLFILFPVVLILCSYGGSVAGQQERPSSHEHLWDRYCLDCHQCEDPTPENPCLKDCPFSTLDMQSAKFPSVSAPDVMVIDELVSLYEPVVFAHKLHADMSNMGHGCSQCHHYSLPDNVPACTECHRMEVNPASMIQPSLKGAYHRQCLGCHTSWDHSGGCNFCHAPIQEAAKTKAGVKGKQLKVPPPRIEAPASFAYQTTYTTAPVVNFHHEQHTLRYGVNCINCHTGEDCAYCHESVVAEASKINRTASCFSCHNQDNCDFCHSTEESPTFRHVAVSGWQLGEQHQELQCAACHGTMSGFSIPKGACGECHTNWNAGNFNHEVTGIALDEIHVEFECEICHQDALFEEKPSCEECHDSDIRYPSSIPGRRVD